MDQDDINDQGQGQNQVNGNGNPPAPPADGSWIRRWLKDGGQYLVIGIIIKFFDQAQNSPNFMDCGEDSVVLNGLVLFFHLLVAMTSVPIMNSIYDSRYGARRDEVLKILGKVGVGYWLEGLFVSVWKSILSHSLCMHNGSCDPAGWFFFIQKSSKLLVNDPYQPFVRQLHWVWLYIIFLFVMYLTKMVVGISGSKFGVRVPPQVQPGPAPAAAVIDGSNSRDAQSSSTGGNVFLSSQRGESSTSAIGRRQGAGGADATINQGVGAAGGPPLYSQRPQFPSSTTFNAPQNQDTPRFATARTSTNWTPRPQGGFHIPFKTLQDYINNQVTNELAGLIPNPNQMGIGQGPNRVNGQNPQHI